MKGVESRGSHDSGRTHLVVPNAVDARIANLVEPMMVDMGFEVVRLHLSGQDGHTLQIMAERPDGTMRVEDCEELSHAVSAVLDVGDPVAGAYRLELSSPGIARPLTRPKDFERWAGYEVKIELTQMLAGRKRFRGILQGFEQSEVLLETKIDGFEEQQTIGLAFHLIGAARLVMTDVLIQESLKKRPHG